MRARRWEGKSTVQKGKAVKSARCRDRSCRLIVDLKKLTGTAMQAGFYSNLGRQTPVIEAFELPVLCTCRESGSAAGRSLAIASISFLWCFGRVDPAEALFQVSIQLGQGAL
jgi:hypothetical protein